MAKLSDLPLWEQAYLKVYPIRSSRWAAPAPVKPLREATVALVTTAGLHLAAQEPFDESRKGGDFSYRWIPSEAAVQELPIAHRSTAFDRAGILADRNVCFPLDRLRELSAEGILGRLNHRHLSFMGSISAPGRLMSRTAPEAVQELKRDGVDTALLVPVWPMCHQTVGLIQGLLEDRGIATVSVNVSEELTRKVCPPRALVVPFSFGYPLGKPNDRALQRKVILESFRLLERTDLPVIEMFRNGGESGAR